MPYIDRPFSKNVALSQNGSPISSPPPEQDSSDEEDFTGVIALEVGDEVGLSTVANQTRPEASSGAAVNAVSSGGPTLPVRVPAARTRAATTGSQRGITLKEGGETTTTASGQFTEMKVVEGGPPLPKPWVPPTKPAEVENIERE